MFSGHWKLSGHLNILTKRWYRFPFCVPLFQYLLNIVYHSEPLIYLSLCFIYTIDTHCFLSINQRFQVSTWKFWDISPLTSDKLYRCWSCFKLVSMQTDKRLSASIQGLNRKLWYPTYKIISWLYQKKISPAYSNLIGYFFRLWISFFNQLKSNAIFNIERRTLILEKNNST